MVEGCFGVREARIWRVYRNKSWWLTRSTVIIFSKWPWWWNLVVAGASTPIFGAQIDAFHSEQPWAITWRQLAKNLHTLARAVTFTMLLMDLAINDLIFHAFVAVWSGCLLFSQQFPVSAHMTKSRLPPL
ncbi:fatty acid desaturase 4, partial [Quercus suber]